jgi:hypothetical protein
MNKARMTKHKKLLGATFALSFAIVTFFGTAVAAPQWSGTVTIVDIEVSDVHGKGGQVYVRFSSVPHSTPCSAQNGQWLAGGAADNVKNIMTVATAAKLAGRPVKVLWNQGAPNQCEGGTTGYPVVVGLDLQ